MTIEVTLLGFELEIVKRVPVEEPLPDRIRIVRSARPKAMQEAAAKGLNGILHLAEPETYLRDRSLGGTVYRRVADGPAGGWAVGVL